MTPLTDSANRTDHDADTHAVGNLADLPVGALRMVRADGHRLCLARTADGVFAVDHACPHQGYGMTQGTLDGNLLTCAWHNWKFDVTDGSCVLGEEGITTHAVSVGAQGELRVRVHRPDPAAGREQRLASLRRGIAKQFTGQIARETVRLLHLGMTPAELVAEGVVYGCARAEHGPGHSMAMATDALAMTELFDGDQRALPIVQALAAFAETERGRDPLALPAPAALGPDGDQTAHRFLAAVEAEDLDGAQALLVGAIEAGAGPDELQGWLTATICAHLLDYGHGAIYVHKAFELLGMIGWAHAAAVLPHLARTIVWGTREDTLPYLRRFQRGVDELDLDALDAIGEDRAWAGRETLASVLLDGSAATVFPALVDALRDGAGAAGVLDAAVIAGSERMLRYDVAGEDELTDDFGWLDITHVITYAHAGRWHAQRSPGAGTLRLALYCAFLAHYSGRHEWHTRVAARIAPAIGADLAAEGERMQRAALGDRAGALIVVAHDIKLSRAATREAVHLGDPRPLQATERFLTSARRERFVASTVAQTIEFLSGRATRDA